MRHKTFYVIGNSIPRSMMYTMVEALGGAHVKRLDQKEACPKHEVDWDSSTCHQEYAGVSLRFLYMNFFAGSNYSSRGGFQRYVMTGNGSSTTLAVNGTSAAAVPVRNTSLNSLWHGDTPQEFIEWKHGVGAKGEIYAPDSCDASYGQFGEKAVLRCLQEFFINATAADALLFSLGHAYTQPSYFAYPSLFTDDIDTERWMLESVPTFLDALCTTFPGHVFRFTMAQLFARNLAVKGVRGVPYEDALWRQHFSPDAASAAKTCAAGMHTIDQAAINAGRNHLYNDGIHYQGLLTHATLQQLFNTLCPDTPLTPLGLQEGQLIRPAGSKTIYLVTQAPNSSNTTTTGNKTTIRAFPNYPTLVARATNATTGDINAVLAVSNQRFALEGFVIGEPLPTTTAKHRLR